MNVKYLFFIALLFLSTNSFLYWEEITKEEQNEIIQNSIANEDVYNLAKGNFIIGDNPQTETLLCTLLDLPSDINLKALYFNLFNQICEKADGAVSETLGRPCLAILLADTEYVAFYLKSRPLLMKTYAQYLGMEFFFKKEGTSDLKYDFTEFKKIVDKRLGDKVKYRSFLNAFYEEIELCMRQISQKPFTHNPILSLNTLYPALLALTPSPFLISSR